MKNNCTEHLEVVKYYLEKYEILEEEDKNLIRNYLKFFCDYDIKSRK